MMHGREKSDSAIVAGKPTNKAGQPDSEPGKRVTRAGAPTANRNEKTLCRHTPKVGAVCPNWARTDLCGGRSVMSVPTAIWRIRPGLWCVGHIWVPLLNPSHW